MWVCSNQFLSQEPGTNQEIKKFAREKGFKGVLMDKVDVNGPKASPVYNFLKVRLMVVLNFQIQEQLVKRAASCVPTQLLCFVILPLKRAEVSPLWPLSSLVSSAIISLKGFIIQ